MTVNFNDITKQGIDLAEKYKYYIIAVVVLAIVSYFVFKKVKKSYPNVTDKQKVFLDTLHPEVKDIFYDFINEAQKNKDVKIEITSAYRDYAHQLRLQKSAGAIAAKAGTSPHNYGLAIDFVVFYKGKRHGLAQSKAEWLETGVPQIWEKKGYTWGGRFTNWPHDPVHFDVVKHFGVKPSKLQAYGLKKYGSPEKVRGNEIPLKFGKA